MRISAIVEALIDAGATPQMILAAVKAAESSNEDALKNQREKAAARSKAYRDRHVTSRYATSRHVSHDQSPSSNDPLPNLTNVDLNLTPTQKEKPPKGGQKKKGEVLSDDWQPSESDFAYGFNLGLIRQDIDDCAEEMRLWAGANSNRGIARKANWTQTFQGWMRRRANERKRAPPRQPVGNGYAQVFRELSGLDNDRTSNIQANIGTISPQLRPYSGVDQVSDLLRNDRHSNWNET